MASKKTTKKNGGKPAEREPKTERFPQTLRCELKPDEIAKKADRAAHLVAEHETKQADLDTAKRQAKAELDRIEAEWKALSGQVRDKAEYRSIECEKLYDFKRWGVTITRLDTGEVVTERPMTSAEKEAAQEALPLPDGAEDEGGESVEATA